MNLQHALGASWICCAGLVFTIAGFGHPTEYIPPAFSIYGPQVQPLIDRSMLVMCHSSPANLLYRWPSGLIANEAVLDMAGYAVPAPAACNAFQACNVIQGCIPGDIQHSLWSRQPPLSPHFTGTLYLSEKVWLGVQGLRNVLDAAAAYSDMRIYRHKAVEFGAAAASVQHAESGGPSQYAPQASPQQDIFQNELVKISPVIISYPRHQVSRAHAAACRV